jgi:PAS domain S-box-containing protein
MELRGAAAMGASRTRAGVVRKDGTPVLGERRHHGAARRAGRGGRLREGDARPHERARRRAAGRAARGRVRGACAAEARTHELDLLNHTLQEQALELEAQTEEAQSLTEDLEQTNTQLEEALMQAEAARATAESSERFTREILESIADPFVVQDAHWRFRYINAKAAEILGGSRQGPEELIGKVVWEVYPEIVGTPVEREMRRAATERRPVSFEARSPDGYRWSLLYCYPLPDGGLATQWKDITERKRSEEAARYLARASEVLSESLDYQRTLNDFAKLVVPELADWCSVEIVDEQGGLVQLAVAHADPEKVKWARELSRRYPPNPDAGHGEPERHPHRRAGALSRDPRRAARRRSRRRRASAHHPRGGDSLGDRRAARGARSHARRTHPDRRRIGAAIWPRRPRAGAWSWRGAPRSPSTTRDCIARSSTRASPPSAPTARRAISSR